jgi:hypothetical protein
VTSKFSQHSSSNLTWLSAAVITSARSRQRSRCFLEIVYTRHAGDCSTERFTKENRRTGLGIFVNINSSIEYRIAVWQTRKQ